MPRPCTADERARISGARQRVYGKLEVSGPDSTFGVPDWIDVSADLGADDWFNSATLTESLDANCQQFRATLLATRGALSLMPLMEGSTLNRDGDDEYAPLLDVRRQWRLSVALAAPTIAGTGGDGTFVRTAGTWAADALNGAKVSFYTVANVLVGPFTVTDTAGDTLTFTGDATGATSLRNDLGPEAGDWKLLGQGYIDSLEMGGNGTTLEIAGRDLGAQLLDWYITSENTYGSADGVARETVLQAILDDNLGAEAPTLAVPVSPAFLVSPGGYVPTGNVMEALNAVAALAGFVVRYRFDATTDAFALTLYEPDRTASGAGDEEWTVAASEYLALPVVGMDVEGVRNCVEVRYVPEGGGVPCLARSPESGTSASITRYGLRYLALDFAASSQIRTLARAQALADAVCSDLEFPPLVQQFEALGFWPVQLGDFVRFTANGVHYDTDQYGGVTQVQHTLAQGTVRTVVGVRGTPAGRYRTWLAMPFVVGGLAPFAVATPRTITATAILYTVTFGVGCDVVEFFTRQHAATAGADPEETDIDSAGRLRRPATGDTATFRIATDASQYRRTFVVGYYGQLRGGATQVMEDQAAAADVPTDAPTISAHTDHAATVDVTVAHNGVVTGEVRLYVNGTLNVEVANAGGANQVVTATGLSPNTAYSITATQVVAGVESAASAALSTTTTSDTLDAPASFTALGKAGDPAMQFFWGLGANAGGASVTIEESATGAWGGEEATVPLTPYGYLVTPAGATKAGSNAHAAGEYYFRAKAQQTGWVDSAWTADALATYGGGA